MAYFLRKLLQSADDIETSDDEDEVFEDEMKLVLNTKQIEQNHIEGNMPPKNFADTKSSYTMEPLINLINKLQDVFAVVGFGAIELPQIVVIGNQSSGKSSVMENIVGKSFLPRGTGIVTRCPLILQLISCPMNDFKNRSEKKGTLALEEWGEFLHRQNEIFSDFDEIRKEIEAATDHFAGDNKGVAAKPINLKIYSNKVVTLTLVDTPGITKVPVGDQPEDIEIQIKNMILEYISNPYSIILAVTAANTDLATSEALKIAKELDPQGNRTLAILTKLDLMDEGTDAVDILTGKTIPVKLGIIGVVNRSQKDIINNESIDNQINKETHFLNQKYPTLASQNGTKYLAKTLSKLLMEHIQRSLPDLKKQIRDEITKFKKKLQLYGTEISDKKTALVEIITKFAQDYSATLDGTRDPFQAKEGSSATKLFSIIHDEFEDNLNLITPISKGSIKEDILRLIDLRSPRPTLFKNPSFDIPFEIIVKQQIKRLKEPSVNCATDVFKEVYRNLKSCGSDSQHDFHRYPKLQKEVYEVVGRLLRTQLKSTTAMIQDLIDSELAYINKCHPDFEKHSALIPKKNNKVDGVCGTMYYVSQSGTMDVAGQSGTMDVAGQSRTVDDVGQNRAMDAVETWLMEMVIVEKKDVDSFKLPVFSSKRNVQRNGEILEKLSKSYFKIVRKTIQDMVPKIIVKFLVNFTTKNIQSTLLSNICMSLNSEDLLDESDEIIEERRASRKILQTLKLASLMIADISGSAFDENDF